MFKSVQRYAPLPQSPGGHTSSERRYPRLLIAWVALVSTLSLLNTIVLSYNTARAFSEVPSYELSKLELRSTYIGFERLYNKTMSIPMHTPITNWPRHLSVVSSVSPTVPKPQGRRYHLDPNGYMSEYEYRVTINTKTSTIAQFRVMDWGMEDCRLVIAPPAANDTNSFALIDGSPAMIDVWKLELDRAWELYVRHPTWSGKPKRSAYLASLNISYNSESQSLNFPCLSGSVHAFELACSSADSDCDVDLMHMGWKNNVIYLQQSQSL
ncbi:hypothetical protein VNI00_004237 [Paramarasmius palmivorus]|uniref:Ubiquitin 3 binding protein But2 C-terminal domain-containing protein n=1 Tax=Paramarasmius palmivorus TaxID=297713 RepID=A0AAW0DR97_9AGAR